MPVCRSLVFSLCCALAACARAPAPVPAHAATPVVATRPVQAVQLLTGHLRDNDLVAFARDAVPPALHPDLESAWQDGRTRWPLDELPFDDRLPSLLKSLAAPDAEVGLQRTFDQQFANASVQIKGAAASLGLFGAQYIAHQGDYSDDERQHYAQLIQAASRWGVSAPLSDSVRARQAITGLAAAARQTRLTSTRDFRAVGMDESLRRIGAFEAVFKRVLASYGLDLDSDLAGMRVTLQQQTGDTARVRMQYAFAGQDIDTVISVQRIDGRWYVSDFLRHAQAAVAPAAEATAAR